MHVSDVVVPFSVGALAALAVCVAFYRLTRPGDRPTVRRGLIGAAFHHIAVAA